ncbi:hypothetical protein K0M31_011904 [Melipona bicolor]|uniref:Uncharacterized protein n=1 Tax=Melipona bicolor TaxID=60889 RepID=A0AA40KV84_9HYME|nr:hypothetical protein K0M31_011904 [Melipona bicolor]
MEYIGPNETKIRRIFFVAVEIQLFVDLWRVFDALNESIVPRNLDSSRVCGSPRKLANVCASVGHGISGIRGAQPRLGTSAFLLENSQMETRPEYGPQTGKCHWHNSVSGSVTWLTRLCDLIIRELIIPPVASELIV